MKLLFDASALLNLIRLLGPEALSYLRGGYILTLTPYEAGNALWREATLMRRITVNDALLLLDLLESAYKVLNAVSPRSPSPTLKLAHRLRVTYYDASYIAAAYELDVGLVTDDEKLRRKVNRSRAAILEVLGREVRLLSTSDIVRPE